MLPRKNIGVLYIRSLDNGIKGLFKAACTRVKKSMQFVFTELMRRYVRNTITINTLEVRQAHRRRDGKLQGFLFFRCIAEKDREAYYAKVQENCCKLNVVTEALLRAFIANPTMFGDAKVRSKRQSETVLRQRALKSRKSEKVLDEVTEDAVS